MLYSPPLAMVYYNKGREQDRDHELDGAVPGT